MKYIIATSDTDYFRWQILVQINNFKKLNILKDVTYVVSIKDKISSKLNKIKKETGARILSYKDERINPQYPSSIRPHILKKHFQKFPEEGELYYYLDPDVIFSKKPQYPSTYYMTKNWILSNTKSYIDSKYIKGKSEELFNLMCEVVNISPKTVITHDRNAGGAQYIIKNAGSEFWRKVEIDSENLYVLMETTKHKYCPQHPIQSWTADMWAVLWNAWYFNNKTLIDSGMNFSWATDPIKNFKKYTIYHNAGVFDQKFLFNKGHYANDHPFYDDHSYVNKEYCSFKYLEEILETKKNYSKLINNL